MARVRRKDRRSCYIRVWLSDEAHFMDADSQLKRPRALRKGPIYLHFYLHFLLHNAA